METMDRERKESTRACLLAEMDQHNRAIIKIKTQLNTLVPVSILPMELLSTIFQIVVDSHSDTRLVSTTPPYAWLSLTHVCTHWRDVAMATPTLWNDIVLPCRLQCISVLLARSQTTPLAVHHRLASSPRRKAEEVQSLEMALQSLHRIRSLTLHLPWELYRKVSSFLVSPAPMLKELSLSTSNMLSCIGRAPPVIRITHALHPMIQKVDLSAYSVSWQELASCHSLRYLSIDYAPFMRPKTNNVADVLNTLRELPLLRTLSLNNVILAPLPADTADGAYVVTLAHLQDLTICGDATTASSLLDNIHHPASTRLELGHAHIGDTEFPLLLPTIRSKLAGGSTIDSIPPKPFRSLAFGLDFKGSFVIRGWSTSLVMDSEATELENELPEFHLELPRWALEFSQIWDMMPLREVANLWIFSKLSEEIDMRALTGVLERMPQVSALYIVDWSSRELIDVLYGFASRRALATSPASPINIVFPRLRELVLRDVVFDACIGHREGHDSCMLDLANTVKARARHGAEKISRIALAKCVHIVPSNVDHLKREIQEVSWDGIVRIADTVATDSESDIAGDAVEGYED